ncbi:MAG: PaaI family thioesterase [Spirochaetes bacterium]|nr:PaaI family thioesterase [Spirochaetota bacterium]
MELEKIQAHLNNHDQYARHSNMKITEIREGYAAAEMTVADHHLNSVNTVHGGAVFTLADFAFACAANSYGVVSVSIQADITMHRPAFAGKISAIATEISRGKTIASYVVKVTNEQEKLLATFNGTVFIKNEPLEKYFK